jgi:hypothetical protein
MWNDPIVDELHQIREARAAHCNNDLRAMADSLKILEQEWLSKFPELDVSLRCEANRLLPKLMSGEIRVSSGFKPDCTDAEKMI